MGLDGTAIRAHALEVLAEPDGSNRPAIEHEDIFETILEELQPIDFHQVAGIDPDKTVTLMHLRVITVREVVKAAEKLDCGLGKRHDYLYTYNRAFWQLVDAEEVEDFLGNAARKLGVDDYRASDYKFKGELGKQFYSDTHLPDINVAPKDKVLINILNGTVEITPGGTVLREFRRSDGLTYQLPFDYDPDATSPLFQRFLDRVLPDKERQTVLLEYFGYIFSPLKLEKSLLLYGLGANGKSVVFDVINAVLGDANVSNYSLESLSHEYFRAMIGNKLLNFSSEMSSKLQAEHFKKLTSGEPVEARLPYGEPMIIKRYARLAFNCNDLPRDVEHSEAYFRRFLIVHFDQSIPESERDPTLAKTIIQSELPGVFNRILDGLRRVTEQQGFSNCDSSRRMIDEYRRESDSVAMFLAEERYVPSTDHKRKIREIYSEYKIFCADNNYRPLGRNNFAKRLVLLNIPRFESYQPFFGLVRLERDGDF